MLVAGDVGIHAQRYKLRHHASPLGSQTELFQMSYGGLSTLSQRHFTAIGTDKMIDAASLTELGPTTCTDQTGNASPKGVFR